MLKVNQIRSGYYLNQYIGGIHASEFFCLFCSVVTGDNCGYWERLDKSDSPPNPLGNRVQKSFGEAEVLGDNFQGAGHLGAVGNGLPKMGGETLG